MHVIMTTYVFALQGPALKTGSAIVKFRVTFTTIHVVESRDQGLATHARIS